jgi:hypothetical protein
MKDKRKRSKRTTYISYTSLRTQVLKKSIVFGLLLVSNIVSAQDSIKCVDLDGQKRILEKFVLLERCQDLRATDSAFIDVLSEENANLIKDLATWEKKAARRNKFIYASGLTGVLFGIFIKSKFAK